MKYFLMRTGCVLLLILGVTAANGASEYPSSQLLPRLLCAAVLALAGLMLGAAAEILDPAETEDDEETKKPRPCSEHGQGNLKIKHDYNTTDVDDMQEGGRRCG